MMWDIGWSDFISFGLIVLAYCLGFRRGMKFANKQAIEEVDDLFFKDDNVGGY